MSIVRAGLIAVLCTAGCVRDDGFKITSAEPTAEITSHFEGDDLMEGFAELFQGRVSDVDNDPEELLATWFIDGTVACAAVAPDASGNTSCAATVPAANTMSVRLEAADPSEGRGDALLEFLIIATLAPTAEIVFPTADGDYSSDVPVAFEGLVGDEEDTLDELIVSWTSSLDGPLTGLSVTPDASGAVTGFASLTEGQHVIVLTVEDTTGKITTDNVAIEVFPPNTPPTCAFTAPDDGAGVALGTQVTFTADVADVDEPAEDLAVTFTSDLDGLMGTPIPASSGVVAQPTTSLSSGTHLITLQVTDEDGATCTDTRVISVSSPPQVVILSPEPGAVLRWGDVANISAEFTDADEPPTGLTVVWSSSLDGVLTGVGPAASGVASWTTSTLSRGLHVLSVRATDSTGLTGDALAAFTVNGPPSAPVVSITPSAPRTEQSATAFVSTASTDPEGDDITYAWAWWRDGVQTALTTGSLPSSETAKGQLWTARATPSDPYFEGPYAEASVEIVNTPPLATEIAINPFNGLVVGVTLTCTGAGTDVDGDVPTMSFVWTVGGTVLSTEAEWTISTASTDPFDVVTCTTTATDDEGATDSLSVSVGLGNAIPVVEVTVTPDVDVTNVDLLTCAAVATDPDGGDPSLTYAWENESGDPLGGGPQLQLDPILAPGGSSVICEATATDAHGGVGVGYSEPIVVLPNEPSIESVDLHTEDGGVPLADSVLECTYDGWYDPQGDEDASTFAWYVDDVLQEGAEASTLIDAFVKDQLVECEVTPFDGAWGGEPLSDTILIQNSPPTAPGIDIEPEFAEQGRDTLVCRIIEAAVDADVETLDYTTAWYVDDVPIASVPGITNSPFTTARPGDSIHAGDTYAGIEWECRMFATDGDGVNGPMSFSVTTVVVP